MNTGSCSSREMMMKHMKRILATFGAFDDPNPKYHYETSVSKLQEG
jgi:hypothetical protein